MINLASLSPREQPSKWKGRATTELSGPSADLIWPFLEDFFGLDKWFPTLTTCVHVEGIPGEPGCVRYCAGFRTPVDKDKTTDHLNWTKQKLLSIDKGERVLSYSIVDGNVGFYSYVSTVRVVPSDGGCSIVWDYEVEPVEGWASEDLDRFIGNGLKVMAQRMEETVQQMNMNPNKTPSLLLDHVRSVISHRRNQLGKRQNHRRLDIEGRKGRTLRTAEDDPSSTVLDLTSCQLHDLSSVELPPGLIELDLTANRLSTLDSRICGLSNLRKLSLRQNLIDSAASGVVSGWIALAELEELVFRDNKLTSIPDASIFKKLLVFDVSFNEIPSLNGLSKVTSTLKELYVSKNDVAKMEEIDHFFELQILELGSNRLRVMENLKNLTNLQELWLGRNRIKAVNLCGLKCIKKISLQSNRLTSMVGFEECTALEELYLSHNGISKMESLSTLVNLRVLDVSSNKIQHIEDIQELTRLEDLWLNDNQIETLDTFAKDVSGSREKLTTIYIGNNPCAKSPTYIALLKEIFPNIQQIDSETFP